MAKGRENDEAVSCLLITPHIDGDIKSAGLQKCLLDSFVKAMKQAGLRPLIDRGVVEVKAISQELIEQLLTVGILAVDVNRYDSPTLSPILSYAIAVGHTRGSRTILLTTSTDHLPPGLHSGHHVIRYDEGNVSGIRDDFERIVERIFDGVEKKPDNQIQEYLDDQLSAQKSAQTQNRIHELEERLKNQHQQPDQSQQPGRPRRIEFRRVH